MKKKITIWEGDTSRINNLKAQDNLLIDTKLSKSLNSCVLLNNTIYDVIYTKAFDTTYIKSTPDEDTKCIYVTVPSLIKVEEGSCANVRHKCIKKSSYSISGWYYPMDSTQYMKVISTGLQVLQACENVRLSITPLFLLKENYDDVVRYESTMSFAETLTNIVNDYTPSRICKATVGNNTYLNLFPGGALFCLYQCTAKTFIEAFTKYDYVFIVPQLVMLHDLETTTLCIQPLSEALKNTWESLGLQELYDEYVKRYGKPSS